MKIIDTHCHLYDSRYKDDLDKVVEECRRNGVVKAFNNADSFPSFSSILSLKEIYPDFFECVLGIHPEFASEDDSYYQKAFQSIEMNKELIKAVGEIGLDYHYDPSDETKERQKALFREQIRLARKLSLPIVVHSRDCNRETFDILKEEKPDLFDLHCYSGSLELLKEYIAAGLNIRIGVGGVVTFKNSRVLKEIVKNIDLRYILTETDSPYLAPHPRRGERNSPAYIPLIIKEIASIKEMDEEECSDILYKNAEEFYGLNR